MYEVYKLQMNYKRAYGCGIHIDDLERAKKMADAAKASWWGQRGIYKWVKVKDHETGKYVYEA